MHTPKKINGLLVAAAMALTFAAPVQSDIGDAHNWVGHGTAYDPVDVQVRQSYLITIVEVQTGEMELETTTTFMFQSGRTVERRCVTTFSESGKAAIMCDNSSGESIRIGSLIQRVMHVDDGTTNSIAVVENDSGDHRENIRTRFSANGAVLGYNRESIDQIN